MPDPVIISAVRTPTGKFLGSLKELSATSLGAIAVRASVARAGIPPDAVEECVMGNVLSAGTGQNPARQAALHGGLSEEVAALTINKVCGSGLKAVMLAAQAIRTGDIDIAVAGGMESMSNSPYLLPRVREGLRMGDGTIVDSMIRDGLWCAFEQCHMGMSAEHVADRYGVPREAQDAYAAASQQKAARAAADGDFRDEVVPLEIPQKKRRHGHRRQRAGRERRRQCTDRHVGSARSCPQADPTSPRRRPGDQRPRSKAGVDDA